MHLSIYINTRIYLSHIDLVTFIDWSGIIAKPDLSSQELFQDLKMIDMRETIRIIDSCCGSQSSLLVSVFISHHPWPNSRAIMAKATWTHLGPFSTTTSHNNVPMVFNSVISSTGEKSCDHGPSVPMDPVRR